MGSCMLLYHSITYGQHGLVVSAFHLHSCGPGLRSGTMRPIHVVNAHGPYLSDRDEAEIEARIAAGADIADLALRTCLCGARLDGFDAYHAHLVRVLTETPAADQ